MPEPTPPPASPPNKPQGAELSAETPRTDEVFNATPRSFAIEAMAFMSLARELERELTAATEALAHRWECQQILERTVKALQGDVAQATEALEKAKAELAASRPMSREEMQAQLDKSKYGDKLTDQMRTHLGCEVSHDMRCDHEGDSLNRVRWNSRAIILLLCALYDQEEAAKAEREQSGKREAALREALVAARKQILERNGLCRDSDAAAALQINKALSQQAPTNDTQ